MVSMILFWPFLNIEEMILYSIYVTVIKSFNHSEFQLRALSVKQYYKKKKTLIWKVSMFNYVTSKDELPKFKFQPPSPTPIILQLCDSGKIIGFSFLIWGKKEYTHRSYFIQFCELNELVYGKVLEDCFLHNEYCVECAFIISGS